MRMLTSGLSEQIARTVREASSHQHNSYQFSVAQKNLVEDLKSVTSGLIFFFCAGEERAKFGSLDKELLLFQELTS